MSTPRGPRSKRPQDAAIARARRGFVRRCGTPVSVATCSASAARARSCRFPSCATDTYPAVRARSGTCSECRNYGLESAPLHGGVRAVTSQPGQPHALAALRHLMKFRPAAPVFSIIRSPSRQVRATPVERCRRRPACGVLLRSTGIDQTTSTAGSGCPSIRSQARYRASFRDSRGAAWRCPLRSTARALLRAPLGDAARVVARVAAPACYEPSVLRVDHEAGQGPPTARRPRTGPDSHRRLSPSNRSHFVGRSPSRELRCRIRHRRRRAVWKRGLPFPARVARFCGPESDRRPSPLERWPTPRRYNLFLGRWPVLRASRRRATQNSGASSASSISLSLPPCAGLGSTEWKLRAPKPIRFRRRASLLIAIRTSCAPRG